MKHSIYQCKCHGYCNKPILQTSIIIFFIVIIFSCKSRHKSTNDLMQLKHYNAIPVNQLNKILISFKDNKGKQTKPLPLDELGVSKNAVIFFPNSISHNAISAEDFIQNNRDSLFSRVSDSLIYRV